MWEGHDPLGQPWPVSWHSIVCLRRLSEREVAAGEADLYERARAIELAKYGDNGGAGKRAAEDGEPERAGRRRVRRPGEYAE